MARATQGERAVKMESDRSIRRVKGYQKVLPRGVVDDYGDMESTESSPWVRGLGLLILLIVLAAAVYFSLKPLSSLLERPLSSVTVEGDFRYVSKGRTTELISAELDGDFLQLDLMRLKSVLEQDPWVEYASLGRRWPDVLLVKMVEQKPIARWGEQSFLNQRGEIIHVGDSGVERLAELPILSGDEADANKIMRQYQDLSQLVRTRGLEVQALSCDRKKSWRMTVRGGVDIVIGRDQVMEKMHRFLTVYDEHLQLLWSDIKTIDVRYSNGVAVRWLPESEAKKQFIKSS